MLESEPKQSPGGSAAAALQLDGTAGLPVDRAESHGGASAGAIALVACAACASMASLRACDALLPELAREFGTTTGLAARTITAYALTYGSVQLFFGPLGDRYGKYRVVAAATLACAVGNLGAAFSASLGALLFWRVAAAAAGAAIVPLSMAWIGDTVPYEHRQATLAHFITGTITGSAAGPFVSGFFADTLGWRWMFGTLAALFLVVGLGLQARVRRTEPARGEPVPAGGTRFFRSISGVLRLPWCRTLLAVGFLEALALFGSLSFVPTYLHEEFGVSLTGAGAVLGAVGLGGLSYTFLARRLVARLGERGLAAAGGAVAGVAFVLVLVGPSWAWSVPATILAGLGFYMLHNTLQTNVTQMAPATRGTGVTLFACSLFMGQSLGVTAGAAVLDRAGPLYLFAASAMAMPLVGLGFSRALQRRAAAQTPRRPR